MKAPKLGPKSPRAVEKCQDGPHAGPGKTATTSRDEAGPKLHQSTGPFPVGKGGRQRGGK